MTIGIVTAYLIGMLAIGWWCSRTKIFGMTDFLLAGRKLGFFLCAGAMAATHFGGGALLGGAEWGFKHGLSGAWYGVSTGVGLIALAFLTAHKFRTLALYTVPDYLETRYGGKTIRILGALLSLIALVGILAAQVSAAAGAFRMIGVTGLTASVLATLVFIVYAVLGGLWAATISDAVQLVIAGIGVCIATVVVWFAFSGQGGFEAVLLAKGVDESYFSLVGKGPSFIAWILLPTVMYTLIGQDFYQRLFAARDAAVAKKAALIGGIFLIVISFLPTIVGMGARGLSTEVITGKEAFPWVLQNLLGPILGGIIISAVIAAIMSTADSLLTAATSHVVNDFWIKTFRVGQPTNERKLLYLARVTTVAIGLIALVIGTQLKGIIDALIYSYTMYTAGVLVPVLGGLLWKRATRWGALAALAIGSIVALIGIITGASFGGAPVEIYAAIVSLVVFVGVSLVTKD